MPCSILNACSGYHKVLHDPRSTWREFLRNPQFYSISIVWMLTRVISNVSQVYLPLYIMDSTDASQVDRVGLLTVERRFIL